MPEGWSLPGLDKVVHVVLFGLPALVLPLLTRRRWVVPLVLVAHAPLSEWVQSVALARRAGDPLDMVADLAGIALGTLAYRLAVRRRWREPA